MSITQKDIKLLWGRAAGICAICRKSSLFKDKKSVNEAFLLGEQAHIVGEKEDAPRGKSILTPEERNSYHNLILLCPTHHKEIDKNVEDWPIERLHMIKSEHELSIGQTLSQIFDIKKDTNQLIVEKIIKEAVEQCQLDRWEEWTAMTLLFEPRWEEYLPEKISKFCSDVSSVNWPDEFGEIKRATITFSRLIDRAVKTFLEHSELKGNSLVADKFYIHKEIPNPNYHEDQEKYKDWLNHCYSTIHEATKAANWFADVVRKDVNPTFFAIEGKFKINPSYLDSHEGSTVLEFSQEEKAAFLNDG